MRVVIEKNVEACANGVHLIGNHRRYVHVHVRERTFEIFQCYGVVSATVVDIENQQCLGINKCGC